MKVNTLWLVRKLGDFSSSFLEEEDIVILIQDGVLRYPSRERWFVCKEDAQARGLKFPDEITKSYAEIVEFMERAKKVIIW